MNIPVGKSCRLWMIATVVILLPVAASVFALPSATATPSASISFAEPDGVDDWVEEGNDFATQILADPWDFDERYPHTNSHHLSEITYENGTLSASVAGDDPYFFLLFSETRHPIDAGRYQRAALHLCVNTENERSGIVLHWFGSGYYYTDTIWQDGKCQAITVDLSTYAGWTGWITALRFDLEALNIGDSFTVDWFRLTEQPIWSNSYEFRWENLETTAPPDSLELFLDTDAAGYDGFLITNIPDPQPFGSMNWGVADQLDPAHLLPLPQDLQVGAYYVYAMVNGSEPAGYGSAPVEIITPEASITFHTPADPGGYYASKNYVGEGKDYATQAWADAWTFDEIPDLTRPHSLKGVAVVDGSLTAEIRGTDPYFFLLFPGMPSAINLNTGQQHPIDAGRYTRASFQLCTDADHMLQQARLYWYYGYTNGSTNPSDIIWLDNGCNVYVYDLSAETNWQGEVNGLRFDLDYLADGETFALDWFRLTEAPDWSNSYEIWWTDLRSTGRSLQLFLDTDASGYDGYMIAELFDAPSVGHVDWGSVDDGLPLPQDFQPGPYYVYARINGQPAGYSSAPLTVSQTPALQFTNPSYTSGPDYATENRSDPWDMDGPNDVRRFRNVSSYRFSDGQLFLDNIHWDPGIELPVAPPINSSKYRFLTIRSYLNRPSNVGHGTVGRALWYNDAYNAATTEDIILHEGWHTYSLDLSKTLLVAGSPQWSASNWTTFRWDPNENVTGDLWRNTIIDDIKLTGPPEADPYIPVQWEIDNPEDEDVLLTLYYDTDNRGLDGVQIEQGVWAIAESSGSDPVHSVSRVDAGYYVYLPSVTHNYCPGDCVVWDTSDIAKGEYYVYACLDDGVNHICRYSDVPVLVK